MYNYAKIVIYFQICIYSPEKWIENFYISFPHKKGMRKVLHIPFFTMDPY